MYETCTVCVSSIVVTGALHKHTLFYPPSRFLSLYITFSQGCPHSPNNHWSPVCCIVLLQLPVGAAVLCGSSTITPCVCACVRAGAVGAENIIKFGG